MNKIPGQPTGPYRSAPPRRPVPPMFDKQRVINLAIVVIGVLIFAVLMVWVSKDPTPTPQYDQPTTTTTLPAVATTPPDVLAQQLYDNDPAGTCYDVAVMNRQAVESMLVGEGGGYLTAEEAIIIYDTLVGLCQEGNWGQ